MLVHDAARPFATSDLFAEVISAALRVGAAIPALPCADTVKRTAEGLVVETLDRSALCLVQTPQVFRRAALLEAYDRLGEAANHRTDVSAICRGVLGRPVARVEGEVRNRKLPRPEDLEASGTLSPNADRDRLRRTHPFGPDAPS